jgi:hypothetical protein
VATTKTTTATTTATTTTTTTRTNASAHPSSLEHSSVDTTADGISSPINVLHGRLGVVCWHDSSANSAGQLAQGGNHHQQQGQDTPQHAAELCGLKLGCASGQSAMKQQRQQSTDQTMSGTSSSSSNLCNIRNHHHHYHHQQWEIFMFSNLLLTSRERNASWLPTLTLLQRDKSGSSPFSSFQFSA